MVFLNLGIWLLATARRQTLIQKKTESKKKKQKIAEKTGEVGKFNIRTQKKETTLVAQCHTRGDPVESMSGLQCLYCFSFGSAYTDLD